MNEIQMLLHEHPVNIERESHAQAPVNSLWLWGNGRLPASAGGATWHTVFGDEVLLQGLARWAGCEHRTMADNADGLLRAHPQGRCLIYFGDVWRKWRELDVYGALDWWRGFQTGWLEPLLAAVRAGRITGLELVVGQGARFRLRRGDSRRWWKRRYPALYRARPRPDDPR